MTDREYESTIRRIRKIEKRWITPCGLRMWRKVDFVYHRDTAEMASAGGIDLSEHQRRVVGRASVDWDYREATIDLNVGKMFYMSDSEIDYTIRHEICHLLVNEMREWASFSKDSEACLRHEERVVSDLASILHWVRCAGADDPKPKKKK